MADQLAPCVAVVGPANSGKTTLLHMLDDGLQRHSTRPLAYVVKGNPDGTGRYLLHAPELREAVKGLVKGSWGEATVETLCGWIDNARSHLELVLLDFGGKHAPSNDTMLSRCSHFIAVARDSETEEASRRVGMASWVEVCERNGLSPVARLGSQWQSGRPGVVRKGSGALEGTFRADACTPGNAVNRRVLEALVAALAALRLDRSPAPYRARRLDRDWRLGDLPTLGGLRSRLEESARDGQLIRLGGRAPQWAYGAVVQHLAELRPRVAIEIFDPKLGSRWVQIPRCPRVARECRLAASVSADWIESAALEGIADSEGRREFSTLDLRIMTGDRLLTPPASESLACLPEPRGVIPCGPIMVCGAVPIWLLLSYLRWLWLLPGQRRLGVWDARLCGPVWLDRSVG